MAIKVSEHLVAEQYTISTRTLHPLYATFLILLTVLKFVGNYCGLMDTLREMTNQQ